MINLLREREEVLHLSNMGYEIDFLSMARKFLADIIKSI